MDEEFDRLLAEAGNEADEDLLLNQASYASDEFLESMLPLAQSMLNLFTVGLYHLFEQQLMDFVRTMNTTLEVSSTTPLLIAELSAAVKVDIENAYDMMPRLNELRLIANTAKHADGDSAKKLHVLRPELFDPYEVRQGWEERTPRRRLVRAPLAGQGLYVMREDFDLYAEAVARFWTRLMVDLDRTFA
jgi:hypothetical protein